MATIHMQNSTSMNWVGFRYWNDALDRAAEQTVEDITETGFATALATAPDGPPREDYGRRPKLLDDIGMEVTARAGAIFITAVNAMSQETGAGPHVIFGDPYLVFFWERIGAWVKTASVDHPGNPAVGFLAAAFEAMDRAAEEVLARNYGSL